MDDDLDDDLDDDHEFDLKLMLHGDLALPPEWGRGVAAGPW